MDSLTRLVLVAGLLVTAMTTADSSVARDIDVSSLASLEEQLIACNRSESSETGCCSGEHCCSVSVRRSCSSRCPLPDRNQTDQVVRRQRCPSEFCCVGRLALIPVQQARASALTWEKLYKALVSVFVLTSAFTLLLLAFRVRRTFF